MGNRLHFAFSRPLKRIRHAVTTFQWYSTTLSSTLLFRVKYRSHPPRFRSPVVFFSSNDSLPPLFPPFFSPFPSSRRMVERSIVSFVRFITARSFDSTPAPSLSACILSPPLHFAPFFSLICSCPVGNCWVVRNFQSIKWT